MKNLIPWCQEDDEGFDDVYNFNDNEEFDREIGFEDGERFDDIGSDDDDKEFNPEKVFGKVFADIDRGYYDIEKFNFMTIDDVSKNY